MSDDREFFLHAVSQRSELEFREDERYGVFVTPFIDAQEAFTAIEEAVDAAEKSIYMAFWFFDPATLLLSRKNTKWSEFLSEKVAKKKELTVRIILSSLDAFLQKIYHREAWKAYRLLQKEIEKLKASDRPRFQVICSSHAATIKAAAEEILLKTKDKETKKSQIDTVLEGLNGLAKKKGIAQAKEEFNLLPGLWENIRLNKKQTGFELAKQPRWVIYPGSHHQKIMIIDSNVAFCGGMDINTRRFDNQKHEPTKIHPKVNPQKLAWHDVQCKVIGEAVNDIERNFLGRWNEEIGEAKKFIERVNRLEIPFRITPIDAEKFTAPIEEPKPPTPPKPGKGETSVIAQVHRTISVDDTSIMPTKAHNTRRADIKMSYEKAINLAESFIYIESQYVRSTDLKGWLIKKAKDENGKDSKLRLIIVVPIAPEEFSEANGADPLTLHGMFLQSSLIKDLKAAFKERFGAYSMVKTKDLSKRATPSTQVYVHSKVLIVDDRFASVGSANANARSFELDTELNVGYVGTPVRDLRIKLWSELLGTDEVAKWKADEFVDKWNAIAAKNKSPKGFIVPHDPAAFPGREYQGDIGIPEEFTQFFDPKTDPADEEAFA